MGGRVRGDEAPPLVEVNMAADIQGQRLYPRLSAKPEEIPALSFSQPIVFRRIEGRWSTNCRPEVELVYKKRRAETLEFGKPGSAGWIDSMGQDLGQFRRSLSWDYDVKRNTQPLRQSESHSLL